MSDVRTAVLELRVVVLDQGTPRRRWNGDPLPSKEVDAALLEAVDGLQTVLRSQGILARTSYGVRSSED